MKKREPWGQGRPHLVWVGSGAPTRGKRQLSWDLKDKWELRQRRESDGGRAFQAEQTVQILQTGKRQVSLEYSILGEIDWNDLFLAYQRQHALSILPCSVAPGVYHLGANPQQGLCCLLSRAWCLLEPGDIHMLLTAILLESIHAYKCD